MKTGRFFSLLILMTVLQFMTAESSRAAFGFGGDDLGKSGLDFNKGYDLHTVTTITGRVISSPRVDDKGNVLADVKSGDEIVSLSLGTKSFWEKNQISISPNDEITAKGSKAQGKDGQTYLLVQKLTNKTNNAQVTVRSERGNANSSGRGGSGMMSNSPAGGMMRGGGGMMRR